MIRVIYIYLRIKKIVIKILQGVNGDLIIQQIVQLLIRFKLSVS